jgi:hypothetical protein
LKSIIFSEKGRVSILLTQVLTLRRKGQEEQPESATRWLRDIIFGQGNIACYCHGAQQEAWLPNSEGSNLVEIAHSNPR